MTLKSFADQRRDGDVGHARVAGGRAQPELVQVVNALASGAPGNTLPEMPAAATSRQRTSQRFQARQGKHHFHLRVPRLDAVFQIDRQHAHADGLDNVLVELLQPLVLAGFLLQRLVQTRVLHRDADVAGQRLQQLHVLAGEEVAFGGLAQAEHGDHAVHHGAGNVVVQLQAADGLASPTASRARPDWCCRRTSGRPATPAAPRAGSRNSARRCWRCRRTWPARTAPAASGLDRKMASRSTSSVRDRRSTIEVSILSRSVSEFRSRPNSISVFR